MTMKLAILFLMYLVLATHAQSCSYSSLCADHTMCKYQGRGSACAEPVHSGVKSDADKQNILAAHNRLRGQVAQGTETKGNPGPQPSAANMRKLSWDDELAKVAQRWADQCNYGHDSCRNVKRFSVGQNVYKSATKGSTPNGKQDWNAAVQCWYDEVKDFNKDDISPFQFTYSTGHYTQVVWADTYKVGCGFSAYSTPDGWYTKFYVCNYGPAGNVEGGDSSMYKTGEVCTQCPAGTQFCEGGLCV